MTRPVTTAIMVPRMAVMVNAMSVSAIFCQLVAKKREWIEGMKILQTPERLSMVVVGISFSQAVIRTETPWKEHGNLMKGSRQK